MSYLATDKPVCIPTKAYIDKQYAAEEKEKLWMKTWQVACREEEIPRVGDFYTYDILGESIIVIRSAENEISAYFNACPHRGRQLLEGCGHTKRIFCKYHGWQWGLDGENTKILAKENWQDSLTDDNTRLTTVKTGRFGGFVFVNPDENPEPFDDFLAGMKDILEPLGLEEQRYKWRKWMYFPCNWKVATEAFIESYHAATTHPQVVQFGGSAVTVSSHHGRHSNMMIQNAAGGGIGTNIDASKSGDFRAIYRKSINQAAETVKANYTDSLLEAADKVFDVLPETATPAEVIQMVPKLAEEIDAKKGISWPQLEPNHMQKVGINWHVFPNVVILPARTYMLGFRFRPNGNDPDSCIFEVFTLERFAKDQEPKPENEFTPETTKEAWCLLLEQDFSNMPFVQKGMHSKAFKGPRPNPLQERGIIHFHNNLASFMGTGTPEQA